MKRIVRPPRIFGAGVCKAMAREHQRHDQVEISVQCWSRVLSWDRPFDQPVPLPTGATARTLRDAANYIRTLPKSVRDCNELRLAVHMLIEAAEHRGPMQFARLGILRAVDRDVARRKSFH
jgi:hypothetical protein